MAEQKQRIEWIDIANGIGIIAVLIGHTNSGILRDAIYSFPIPLFIFLSAAAQKRQKIFLFQKSKGSPFRTIFGHSYFSALVCLSR